MIEAPETAKCTEQPAVTVVKNVKSLLNQQVQNQFFVVIALKKTAANKEDPMTAIMPKEDQILIQTAILNVHNTMIALNTTIIPDMKSDNQNALSKIMINSLP